MTGSPARPRPARLSIARRLALACAGLIAFAAGAAHAQSGAPWPNRPVRIIATSPPGGSVDLLARILAEDFAKAFGQPFVVDNRPGANGNVGADAVVKAPPDGHMLFVTIPGVFSINQHLHEKMPFDPRTEVLPVALLGTSPLLLVLHPSVPASDVRELIAWLRERPGRVSYSSQGVGTTGHLGMELFKAVAKVDVVHIPYKGAAAATTDLISGQVLLTLTNTTAAIPYMQRKQMKAIAVAERQRILAAPEVPTFEEAGMPGFEVTPWFGLGTRTGVPRDIVARLNAQAEVALKRPEVGARLAALGVEPRSMPPAAFADYVKAESARWGEIIRRSGAKAE